MRRAIRAFGTLLLVFIGISLSLQAQAPSDPYQAYEIVNKFSGQVLDVVNSSLANAAQIQQRPYGDGSNQKWRLIPADGAYFEVMNALSGKVLDDTDWSASNGKLVQQYDWGGGDNQQWQFVPVDNGQYYAIRNKYSGKVLDDTDWSTSDGKLVQQYDWGAMITNMTTNNGSLFRSPSTTKSSTPGPERCSMCAAVPPMTER